MATTGRAAYMKYFNFGKEIKTTLKKDSPKYHPETMQSMGTVSKGHAVTFINEGDYQSKALVRDDKVLYRIKFDTMSKPGSGASGRIDLKPQAFGLGAPLSLSSYVTTLKKSIKNRGDIKGELQEYLLDLVDYVTSGSGGLTGYKFTELPMAYIRNDFGEALGPIFCIKYGLIGKNLGVNASSTISFPGSGAAQLLDYIINTPTKRIKVSAKSKGTANTLKMVSLVPTILNDSNLSAKHASSLEFRLMNTINSNNTNMGAIQGCVLIGAISQQAAASVSGLRGNSASISDISKQLFGNLILNDARLKSSKTITLRNIAYVCEKKIVEFSKKTMVSKKFTEIVKDVLNNEVFYVKLDIDNGIPKFNIVSTSDRTISGLHFRNKNGYDSTSDKLGFKI